MMRKQYKQLGPVIFSQYGHCYLQKDFQNPITLTAMNGFNYNIQHIQMLHYETKNENILVLLV